jgi:hypothetical protein
MTNQPRPERKTFSQSFRGLARTSSDFHWKQNDIANIADETVIFLKERGIGVFPATTGAWGVSVDGEAIAKYYEDAADAFAAALRLPCKPTGTE